MSAHQTEAELAELRRLAMAATPGLWHREMLELGTGGPMTIGVGSKGPPVCIMNGIVESPRGNRDASYVAAVSPAAVLALLDRLESLEKNAARFPTCADKLDIEDSKT